MFDRVRSMFNPAQEDPPEIDAARNLEVRGFSDSHPGAVRPMNEDRVALHIPQPYRPEQPTLALVADGMGGARGGEVASELAIQLIPRLFFASNASPERALEQAIQSAGREIFEHARRKPELNGMGTTCVATVIIPPYAWVAWVGDSRLYLIRAGRLMQLTEDHSVVQEMVRKGMITEDEAAHHSDKNLVTRSLGVHKSVEIGARAKPVQLQPGDSLLLCSDGLTDVLMPEDLVSAIDAIPVDIACKSLISEANRRGAGDNVSAIVLSISPPSSSADLLATREFDATKVRRITR